jgi:NAD(P)-dependent dehydrogenase (short-subunit alcohol dehydrogenase family)
MANTFCVVGATRGTGLQIASQLLQRGKHVRVVARDSEKARRLLGDRAQVFGADVTVPSSLRTALDADCRAIFFAVDVTGGIGGRLFFGSASKIRDVTYQGLVNVVEAVRANRFGGRIVLLSGMGADRPSLAGAILNAIKGNLQKNMVDRERFWKAAGSTTRCAEALSLPTSLAGNSASGSQPRRTVLISGAGLRGPTSPAS